MLKRWARISRNMNDQFKYDVAFSLLSRDEQLALQIADRIRDRVNVFVYTEKQEVFAGTDGMDQHMLIYQEEARVIVVLFREGWGQTDWTRVEETAIRNRVLKGGYDFIVFIALDSYEKPKWLPKTKIWGSLERNGVNGIASVIEATIQAEGGTVQAASAVDYAARRDRELNFKSQRKDWYNSENGVESAARELDKLFSELERLAKEITEHAPRLQLTFSQGRHDICKLECNGIELQITWRQKYKNRLEGSELRVMVIEYPIRDQWSTAIDPIKHHEALYALDWDLGRQVVWRELNNENRLFTSLQLADQLLKTFLDEAVIRSESAERT